MLHVKNILRLVSIFICAALFAGCTGTTNTPPSPVIRNFTATPSIISKGQATTLFLNFTGGTGRIVSFGNNTTVSRITFGNATTIKPTATTTYTLTVTRFGVKVSHAVTVTLSPILGRYTSSVGKTVEARDGHTATLLPSGKVLLAGGSLQGGAIHYHKSAELFDPASGISTPTGFMVYSSALHTATSLNNGKVLLTGGWDGFKAHSEAQLYDPGTGSFTATGTMAGARSLHTATFLPNGKILITGGFDGAGTLSSAELYDPAAGTFAATGSMAVARFAHAATLLNNGKVLITGGTPDSTLCELYDPGSGTFTTTGRMVYARSYHTATQLSNELTAKILIAGGATGNFAELYDPVTGTFALTSSMTTSRTYHTATLLSDSRVLLSGGSDNSAEFYDPNTRSFGETVKPMKEARARHTATILPNGLILIVGGTGAINRSELFR